MDLLKTVLKKTQNTLEDRLNCSTTSEMSLCGYETALDQSNSIYFSMSENDGDKTTTFDDSLVSESTLKCSENSIIKTMDTTPTITIISSTPMKITNILQPFETVVDKENVAEVLPCIINVPDITFDTYDNDNIIAVNPFTCGVSKNLNKSVKKPLSSISKIATRNYMYNPIQRKSIDKMSPMFANRRSFAITKTTQVIKPTEKVIKTKITFPCEWCKKSFELNKALTNHLIEYCQKIPCNEKKKLLNPVTSNPEQKRKSVFIMPGPKKPATTYSIN
ncbi:unnamed protein product [Diamesa serratosioi]